MNPSNKIYKSHAKIYWMGYILLASILFASICFRLVSWAAVFVPYVIFCWIPIMAFNLYEGHRLMSCLKQNHREEWKYLTYVPFLGPRDNNSFRILPFLYFKDDLNDAVADALKENYKKFILFALVAFLTFPILAILCFVLKCDNGKINQLVN